MENDDELLEEHTYPSMFGEAEVFTLETEEGTPLRVLYVDGGFQSATYLGEARFKAPFAYVRALAQMISAQGARRVLLLGGGTYSLPKHLLGTAGAADVAIDVVEIDPTVVEIARRHFFVDELECMHGAEGTGRLRTYVGDGAAFLASCDAARYDAIVNDCFAGTVQDAPLLSAEALSDARRALTQNGIYLLNAVAETDDGEDDLAEIERIEALLNTEFSQIEHVAVEDDEFAGSINHLFRCMK